MIVIVLYLSKKLLLVVISNPQDSPHQGPGNLGYCLQLYSQRKLNDNLNFYTLFRSGNVINENFLLVLKKN